MTTAAMRHNPTFGIMVEGLITRDVERDGVVPLAPL